ncbi:MAG: OmpA family protein [Sphingobacteriaceae bacterium]
MNYCKLIKRGIAFSLVASFGMTASNAQNTSSKAITPATKVFGGRAQYKTWNIGVNAGVLAPVVPTGTSGTNNYTNWDLNLGYGLTIRKQLAHSFGFELSGLRGTFSGSNKDASGGVQDNLSSYKTNLDWAANLMGVVNVATIDFLRRENNVNFLLKAGFGVSGYSNKAVDAKNNTIDNGNTVTKQIPVGLGVKFKISDRINFDLGYNMYFLNSVDLDGGGHTTASTLRESAKDKYSYGYGGIEFVLGSKSKPNLDWVNPVAMMYDELKDPSLRKELDSLKKHVAEQDKHVADQDKLIADQGTKIDELSKDSDGDGVPDKFDKCPNTPAGTKVDGSGCPICPTGCEQAAAVSNGNIQFEFDSSVLKTSSFPALDKLSSDIKSGVYTKIRLEGFASIEGTPEYNMQLSIDRANSVKTYLVNAGVPSSKLTVKGFGTKRPIASNDTEEGRILNRRVEIKKK